MSDDTVSKKYHQEAIRKLRTAVENLQTVNDNLTDRHEKEIQQIRDEYKNIDQQITDIQERLKEAMLVVGRQEERNAELEKALVDVSINYSKSLETTRKSVRLDSNYTELLRDVLDAG